MLNKLFGKQTAPVVIDIKNVLEVLELDHSRFRPDPEAHLPVIFLLGEYSLRGTSRDTQHARSYYSDYTRNIKVKPDPKTFSDEPDEEDMYLNCSANVAFTEQPHAFGKRGFGLIIRQDARDLEGIQKSMVFGLYGTYDRDGRMTVNKLMVPQADESGRFLGVHPCPVTAENVTGALHFAKLCAQAIYSDDLFYARDCYYDALEADLGRAAITPLPPAP